ncbi:hypothetical protein [Yoonia sp.]|uniref:hypothetical protein n=1 Tax=Yoonia sp. TaxID=2212373 RepID=UPI002FD92A60
MQLAGYFILVSAALHVAGVAVAGFAAGSLVLLVPAALYVLFYAGLARRLIWVAWIAFIAMLGGSMGAISELYAASPVPDWVFAGILGADICAAILLFGAIWRGRPASRA